MVTSSKRTTEIIESKLSATESQPQMHIYLITFSVVFAHKGQHTFISQAHV